MNKENVEQLNQPFAAQTLSSNSSLSPFSTAEFSLRKFFIIVKKFITKLKLIVKKKKSKHFAFVLS